MSLSEISIGAFILSAKSTANFINTFGTDPGLTYHDTITINGSSTLIGGSGEIVNINPFDNSGNDPITQNIYVKNTRVAYFLLNDYELLSSLKLLIYANYLLHLADYYDDKN